MSDQNNTPPPPEGELKFQMQAMTQMMGRMNYVMGNVCDRLDGVERRGNEAGTSTQNVRKVGAEPKANYGSRADGGFEDETIGHWAGFRQPRNRRDFGNRTRGQFGKGEISVVLGDMMI